MSHESLDQFRQWVLDDPARQEELLSVLDRESFIGLVVQRGQEQGYSFTNEDVTAAMQASWRAWHERWIR